MKKNDINDNDSITILGKRRMKKLDIWIVNNAIKNHNGTFKAR